LNLKSRKDDDFATTRPSSLLKIYSKALKPSSLDHIGKIKLRKRLLYLLKAAIASAIICLSYRLGPCFEYKYGLACMVLSLSRLLK